MGNISAYDGQPEISHEQSLEMYPTDNPNELCDYTVGDIMIDYEAWDRAEDLSESESEDGNYDEVSDISDNTSLEEEDEELLLQSFLTMDIDNNAHYIYTSAELVSSFYIFYPLQQSYAFLSLRSRICDAG